MTRARLTWTLNEYLEFKNSNKRVDLVSELGKAASAEIVGCVA